MVKCPSWLNIDIRTGFPRCETVFPFLQYHNQPPRHVNPLNNGFILLEFATLQWDFNVPWGPHLILFILTMSHNIFLQSIVFTFRSVSHKLYTYIPLYHSRPCPFVYFSRSENPTENHPSLMLLVAEFTLSCIVQNFLRGQ